MPENNAQPFQWFPEKIISSFFEAVSSLFEVVSNKIYIFFCYYVKELLVSDSVSIITELNFPSSE